MDPPRSVSRSFGSATAWRATRTENRAPPSRNGGGASAHGEAATNPQGPITRRRAVLLIVCAWLLALGVAFFLNRGEDAGQLAGLLRRAFGAITEHRIVGAAGLLASAEGLLIAGLIVL